MRIFNINNFCKKFFFLINHKVFPQKNFLIRPNILDILWITVLIHFLKLQTL